MDWLKSESRSPCWEWLFFSTSTQANHSERKPKALGKKEKDSAEGHLVYESFSVAFQPKLARAVAL